jgi:hypothetical protein
VSALDRVRAVIAQDGDPDRREVLSLADRPIALKVRPSTWAEDRAVQEKIAAKKRPEEQIDLAAIHVARYVEAVYGVAEDGVTTEPLYGDGGDALLDQRLADELQVPFVSPGKTLLALLGQANVEQAFFWHSQWSVPSVDGQRVSRLGESTTPSPSGE